MNKQTFHASRTYRLLQVLFISSYIILATILILMGLYGSDVQPAGLFWALILAIIYYIIKKLFYYIMFNDSILPTK